MRAEDRTGRRTVPWRARAAASALTALIMMVLAWFPAPAQATASATAHPARPTVVSLTFDDGTAGQFAAAQAMHRYGVAGTFFIITGAVGAPNYMSLPELRQLAANGDEIGGHTVSHLDLVDHHRGRGRRQACAGRDILTRWGFRSPRSPTRTVPRTARWGRRRGLRFQRCPDRHRAGRPGLPGLRAAETVPPADPFAVRTPARWIPATTLADLEQSVLRVQRTAAAGCRWCSTTYARRTAAGCCPSATPRSRHSCVAGRQSEPRRHGRDHAPGDRRAGAAG